MEGDQMTKVWCRLGLLWAIALGSNAHAAAAFVDAEVIPGNSLDLSGGTGVNDGRLGFFSDIFYDSARNEWWALSDRGPGGGSLHYSTRAQRFEISINAVNGKISDFAVLETFIFRDEDGDPLDGIAPKPTNQLGNSFDPEGIVIDPHTGDLYVSDEYGPSLYEFDRGSGNRVGVFTTPANLVPRNAANVPNYADDTGNTAGKRTNRGFEGLAISPDGDFIYAMLQSAMLDEGGGNGFCNRIVKFDTTTRQAVRQYAYKMESSGQGRGISALLALNDHEFLVLERNNRGIGVGATLASPNKKVFRIDLAGAADVTDVAFSTVTDAPCPDGKARPERKPNVPRDADG